MAEIVGAGILVKSVLVIDSDLRAGLAKGVLGPHKRILGFVKE